LVHRDENGHTAYEAVRKSKYKSQKNAGHPVKALSPGEQAKMTPKELEAYPPLQLDDAGENSRVPICSLQGRESQPHAKSHNNCGLSQSMLPTSNQKVNTASTLCDSEAIRVQAVIQYQLSLSDLYSSLRQGEELFDTIQRLVGVAKEQDQLQKLRAIPEHGTDSHSQRNSRRNRCQPPAGRNASGYRSRTGAHNQRRRNRARARCLSRRRSI
jgi:hypothetical protein